MWNVSKEFRQELLNDNVNYEISADITFSDGNKITVDRSNIWQNGLKTEKATSNSGNFDIGSAIVGKLTLVLNNIYEEFSDYDFTGAVISNIKVGLKLKNGTTENVRLGVYTVDDNPSYDDATITLTCNDNMIKFDRPYSESNLQYPATLRQIVQDACSVCNVLLRTASFENENFVVQERPSDENLTFRQILLWVAQISCNWMTCDQDGRLLIKWYDTPMFENQDNLDGGTFKPWSDDNDYSGGTFNPWSKGDTYSGGDFLGLKNYHHIFSIFSMDMSTDDVIITGIKVTEYVDTTGEEEPTTYQVGTDGYVLGISGNQLIQEGKGNEVCNYLANKVVGMRFRPLSIQCTSDPTVEAGDCAIVTDRKGRSYQCYLNNVSFSSGGNLSVSCEAQSPARNSVSRYSESTSIYQTIRKNYNKQKTEWEKAFEDLNNVLENSSGLYITVEEQEDGSSIYYMHNKPELADSDIVWKITAEGFGISTDGGKTYPFGFTVTGEMLVSILNTIGINADWINSGSIHIQNPDGETTFLADTETGQVVINAESIKISGKSVEQISDEKINDFIDTVYNPAISDLQNQIDGQIETWFYDYLPTTSNLPASEWKTEADKNKHLGDLFYVVDNDEYGGFGYRWALVNGNYSWQAIEDVQALKALEQASKAQDTADKKRRTFLTTPVPPYDEGDLWTQGTSGDIMTCVRSRQSGSYVSSDWEKSSKYTDDTVANEALEEAKNAKLLSLSLDNEYQGIPTDANGNYTSFPECKTRATVFFGSNDISSSVTYSIAKSTSVTGSWNLSTRTYTVTGLSADSGWVDITVSYLSGALVETKRFSIVKQKQGQQGLQGLQGEKGDQGIPGTDGAKGPQGPQGPAGQDGKTSYFHIKYSENPDGNPMTETPSTYIGTYVDFEEQDSNNYTKYTWARFEGLKGDQGIPGTNGENGQTSYLHIAYANSADGTKDFSVSDGAGKSYIGQYTDFTAADSTDPKKYTWTKIKGDQGPQGLQGLQGPQGEQGIPGTPGKDGTDGKTSYFHIKYSAVSNPTSSSQMSETPNTYIGTYVDFTAADSTDPADYTWYRFQGLQGSKGEQGIPGTNGENGETSYLHIKYSNDGGKTFTSNNGETPGEYIGQYVDFNQTDSSSVSSYTWSKIKGDTGAAGRTYFISLSTNVIKKDASDGLYPSTITINLYYRDGSNATRTAYAGRIKIEETTNGSSYTTKYTSSSNESSKVYTPSKDAQSIKISMYAAGGTSTMLDTQSVAVLKDIGNLTQEEVFNILTNNGEIHGIFMQDGQLYINGRYIQSNSIRVAAIAGSDLGNLATVTEYDEGSMLPSNFALGGTKRHNPNGTWELQRYNYQSTSNLPLSDFTPNRLKNGDRIACDFEVYLVDTSQVKDVAVWYYDANKKYVHTNYTRFTAPKEQWTTIHAEIDLVNIPNSAVYFIVGVNFHTTSANDVIRKAKFTSMIGGNLVVDNSITARKINVQELATLNATIGGWKITTDGMYDGNSSISAGIGKNGKAHAFWAGTNVSNNGNAPFRVGHDGSLTCTKANVTGTLNSGSGNIAGWTLAPNYLYTKVGSNYSVLKNDGDVAFATASPSESDTTGATCQIWHDGHFSLGDTKNSRTRTEFYGDRWNMYNDQGFAFRLVSAGGIEFYGDPTQNPTPYMDWHYNGDTGDYSVRLRCTGYDTLVVEGGTLNTGSDSSLKKDMKMLDEQFEKFFKKIVPVSFRYKDSKNSKKQIGYNANNIQKAATDAGIDISDLGLFHVDDKGDRSLAYMEFSALNTYMIQKSMERIDSLESEIIDLKNEIMELKQLVYANYGKEES